VGTGVDEGVFEAASMAVDTAPKKNIFRLHLLGMSMDYPQYGTVSTIFQNLTQDGEKQLWGIVAWKYL
jgi:hypothetical protein